MAAILMYHRIGEPSSHDPWDLVVSPEHFSDHLRVLHAGYDVISLQELCACHRSGHVPERAVCLTFDDGYYDNLSIAKPLLEDAGVPATVFLATGFLGTPSFWWDRLVDMFTKVGEGGVNPDRAAAALGLAPPVTLERVWRLLRDLLPAERESRLDGLACELGVAEARPPGVRPMTEEEASQLVSPLISIGAHTVGHPWLPAFDESRVAQEIHDSLRRCEEFAASPVRMLAYPYGAHDETVVAVAARSGVECAVTTVAAPVTSDASLLALPRLTVPDCDRSALERRLAALCVG